MKTRNGFVSNSSSSSFVIAIKNKNKPCPHCGRKDPNFLDMIEQSNLHNDDNCIYARSAESTLEYLENNGKTWMSSKDYEMIKKSIVKYRTNKKWDVAYITLSYHDEDMQKILDNMVSSGNAKILYRTD